jgi:hypothetical protein
MDQFERVEIFFFRAGYWRRVAGARLVIGAPLVIRLAA